MSRFDWDTYNATKDSAGGAVHATRVDWADYLPDVEDEEGVSDPATRLQIVLVVVFAACILAFFGFVSSLI